MRETVGRASLVCVAAVQVSGVEELAGVQGLRISVRNALLHRRESRFIETVLRDTSIPQ